MIAVETAAHRAAAIPIAQALHRLRKCLLDSLNLSVVSFHSSGARTVLLIRLVRVLDVDVGADVSEQKHEITFDAG